MKPDAYSFAMAAITIGIGTRGQMFRSQYPDTGKLNGKWLLLVGRNKDQEWRGNAPDPHILIKLFRIRAARYDLTALQHYPLAEELRIGAGGPRHLS
jgi:hypothetical protein